MCDIHKDVQAALEEDPDAVECGACNLLFKPEKFDGELLVHVVRFDDDPEGMPGTPIGPGCMAKFQRDGKISRPVIEVR
jgi:hypothetical protein